MTKYRYIATIGDKYQIQSFKRFVPLRLDHLGLLEGKVYFHSTKTLAIETTLFYEIGQKVSISGYPMRNKKFRLIELSITDNPVLDKACLIAREEI